MEIEGRLLTNTERSKVRDPFSKDEHIEKWTLKKMKTYIDVGVDVLSKDKDQSEMIFNSIKNL